jgi:two-component sensor histidine kinase
MPLSMILVEWYTNSCKYGAHSAPAGGLRVEWTVDHRGTIPWVELRWRERGGPPVRQPVRPSLGTKLVHEFAARELGGRCRMDFGEDGADHALEFPVA